MTSVDLHTGIRVLVADDHLLVREGLCRIINTLEDVNVVATAGNGQEVLDLLERLPVDVALIDFAMPVLNGIETTRRMHATDTGARAMIMSMYSSEEYVVRALRCGACGFLLKDAGLRELDVALRAAARGELFICPSVARPLIHDRLDALSASGSEGERLTDRQLEVLQLIAEGLTSKAIARHLGISIKTVETHRAHIMRRMDVSHTAALVREAVRLGLVAPDP